MSLNSTLSEVFLYWLTVLSCTERLCRSKLLDCVKLSYGFSPVWTNMWIYRLRKWLNFLLHMQHSCSFSAVWTLLCTTRLCILLNGLPQTVQCFPASYQSLFCSKPFVTRSTQIRLWLVIMWMLSVITVSNFSLYFTRTFTCTTQGSITCGILYMTKPTKFLLTHVTFVCFISTVNSAILNQVRW